MPFSHGLLWFVISVSLFIFEFICPGFILFFFGIGALVTASISYLFPEIPLAAQIACFIILSLAALFIGRRTFSRTFKGKEETFTTDADNLEMIGRIAIVIERITPDVAGRIELNGSTWSAAATTTIEAGEKVTIIAHKNISFVVAPVQH